MSAEPGLEGLGFITEPDGDNLQVVDSGFRRPAESAGLESGFTQGIIGYYQVVDQPEEVWFLLPPLLLFVIWGQMRRKAGADPVTGE